MNRRLLLAPSACWRVQICVVHSPAPWPSLNSRISMIHPRQGEPWDVPSEPWALPCPWSIFPWSTSQLCHPVRVGFASGINEQHIPLVPPCSPCHPGLPTGSPAPRAGSWRPPLSQGAGGECPRGAGLAFGQKCSWSCVQTLPTLGPSTSKLLPTLTKHSEPGAAPICDNYNRVSLALALFTAVALAMGCWRQRDY